MSPQVIWRRNKMVNEAFDVQSKRRETDMNAISKKRIFEGRMKQAGTLLEEQNKWNQRKNDPVSHQSILTGLSDFEI